MEFKTVEEQLESIREIFETARTEDGWNPEAEMLYSYFFIDKDAEKLETLGLDLEKQGFDFIDIFELAEEESGEATGEYLLHIDKVEIHTPDSLAARNVEFQNMANEYEIDSYDGWEFGEVDDEDEEAEEAEEEK